MKEYKDFFEQLNEIKRETESSIFDQIRRDWGYSSVTLKNWLSKYHPLDLEMNYTKQYGLNVDLFLPYRKNALWSGDIAISRLKLAVSAKAYIIFNNESPLNDNMLTFKIECLRLWLRIDSLKTKYTLDQFTEMTNDAAKQAIDNSEWLYEYLIDKQNNFTYTKTLYHYKKEDFDSVQHYMTLREAYDDWMKYTFPHLLEYYKKAKQQEFKIWCLTHQASDEYKELKMNRLNDELNALRVKEPSKPAFRKMLQKFDIKYKQIEGNSRKK